MPAAGCSSAEEAPLQTQVQLGQAQPAPEVEPYWEAFLAQRSGPIAVRWNAGAGTPHSLYGALSAPAGEANGEAAIRFLEEHAPLFRMPPALSGIELVESFDSPMGRHVVFVQRAGGAAVYGAQVKVHFNRDGWIVAVNNSYVPGLSIDSVAPSLAFAQALGLARAVMPAQDAAADAQSPTGELVVYPSSLGASLAWRLVVPSIGPTWQVFIAAHTGVLLAGPVDINHYMKGSGQIFNINPVVALQDNRLTDTFDMAAAVPSGAYSMATLEGLTGTGFVDGEYASSAASKNRAYSASHTFIYNRSNSRFNEVMAYYYIDYAQRYIQSLGFSNVNNRQQVFSVNLYKKDNSYYTNASKAITFGTGGVDDAEDGEVILHEYGHAMLDNQVPDFGLSPQAAAMTEGFCDYWAASVGAEQSGGFQDNCVADWDATFYSATDPPCLRRLDSTKHYPESITGDAHDDGEIWSAALWQIRADIGAARADKAILQAHFLLSPTADFSDGGNALVIAAQSLGYSLAEVSSIRSILLSRGFYVTL